MTPATIHPFRLTLAQQCELLRLLSQSIYRRGQFPGPVLALFDSLSVEPAAGSEAVVAELSPRQLHTLADQLDQHQIPAGHAFRDSLAFARENGTPVCGRYLRKASA